LLQLVKLLAVGLRLLLHLNMQHGRLSLQVAYGCLVGGALVMRLCEGLGLGGELLILSG